MKQLKPKPPSSRYSTLGHGVDVLSPPKPPPKPTSTSGATGTPKTLPRFMAQTAASRSQASTPELMQRVSTSTPVGSGSGTGGMKLEKKKGWVSSAAKRVGIGRFGEKTPTPGKGKDETKSQSSTCVSSLDKREMMAVEISKGCKIPVKAQPTPSDKKTKSIAGSPPPDPNKPLPTEKPLPSPPIVQVITGTPVKESRTLVDVMDRPLRRSFTGNPRDEVDWPTLTPNKSCSNSPEESQVHSVGTSMKTSVDSEELENKKSTSAKSTEKFSRKSLPSELQKESGESDSNASAFANIAEDMLSKPQMSPLVHDASLARFPAPDVSLLSNSPSMTTMASYETADMSPGGAALEKFSLEHRLSTKKCGVYPSSSLRSRISLGSFEYEGPNNAQNRVLGFTDFTTAPSSPTKKSATPPSPSPIARRLQHTKNSLRVRGGKVRVVVGSRSARTFNSPGKRSSAHLLMSPRNDRSRRKPASSWFSPSKSGANTKTAIAREGSELSLNITPKRNVFREPLAELSPSKYQDDTSVEDLDDMKSPTRKLFMGSSPAKAKVVSPALSARSMLVNIAIERSPVCSPAKRISRISGCSQIKAEESVKVMEAERSSSSTPMAVPKNTPVQPCIEVKTNITTTWLSSDESKPTQSLAGPRQSSIPVFRGSMNSRNSRTSLGNTNSKACSMITRISTGDITTLKKNATQSTSSRRFSSPPAMREPTRRSSIPILNGHQGNVSNVMVDYPSTAHEENSFAIFEDHSPIDAGYCLDSRVLESHDTIPPSTTQTPKFVVSKTDGTRIKRLSMTSPDFGPVLKISRSAEDIIMGTNESDKENKDPARRARKPSIVRSQRIPFNKENSGLSRMKKSTDLRRKVTLRELEKSAKSDTKISRPAGLKTEPKRPASSLGIANRAARLTSRERPIHTAAMRQSAPAAESTMFLSGANTNPKDDPFVDNNNKSQTRPKQQPSRKISAQGTGHPTSSAPIATRAPRTSLPQASRSGLAPHHASNQAAPRRIASTTSIREGREKKYVPKTKPRSESTPPRVQHTRPSPQYPPRSSSRSPKEDFTINGDLSSLEKKLESTASKSVTKRPSVNYMSTAERANRPLSTVTSESVSKFSKRDSRGRAGTVLSNFRGLFHHNKRLSDVSSLLAPPVKTINKSTLKGSPFTVTEVDHQQQVDKEKVSNLSNASNSTRVIKKAKSFASLCSKASTIPPTPIPDEISRSTDIAMRLINSARQEASSAKKEKLLELGKVLVEAITQARDAEKAMEEAKQAAQKAEMSYTMTKKSVAEVSELVGKARNSMGDGSSNASWV
ncbi:MAG: hypothetical protein M1834_005896 [Cirrosporium novae-zelandiae]|nr:MAG: hypothetical protein M1834_005896 [Cirrosporium novae-zelandiae]